MKAHTLLYILFLPFLGLSQIDSLSFELIMETDSSIYFSEKNEEFFDYFDGQLDSELERGFFPKEKAYAKFSISEDGKLTFIEVLGSSERFNEEIKRAAEDINVISISNLRNPTAIVLLLVIKRWKEVGEFSMHGRIISSD